MLDAKLCYALLRLDLKIGHLRVLLAVNALTPHGQPRRLYVEDIADCAGVGVTTAYSRLKELESLGIVIRRGPYAARFTRIQRDVRKWKLPDELQEDLQCVVDDPAEDPANVVPLPSRIKGGTSA